ncbi:MAG TPA: hypothetical protein VF653_03920 [Methylomirabilota bacterium]
MLESSWPWLLAAVLLGLGALWALGTGLHRAARAWWRARGTRVVVCPESRSFVAVEVDARRAALAAADGRRELRLESCTRWPERAGCGQECLGQIEAAPESCLLRTILADFYRGKTCTFCARSFRALRWHDHQPGLLSPKGEIRGFHDFRPEQVMDVLATHEPVCWDCRMVEAFRHEHPELVTDRPPRKSPPPSMS